MRSKTLRRLLPAVPRYVFTFAMATLASMLCAGCMSASQHAALDIAGIANVGTFRPVPVRQSDFSNGTDRAALEQANPASAGGRILRDEMLADTSIKEAVERNGLPTSVELESAQDFAMFYRNPARTIVSQTSPQNPYSKPDDLRGYAVTMNYVPLSVRRISFGETDTPEPWPVTITPNDGLPFAMPPNPAPLPTSDLDGKAYANYAASIVRKYPAVGPGDSSERVARIFAALKEVAQTPGIDWKLVVFDSQSLAGFGEPDGTIFISNALVSKLNDAELTAAIAHVMGHERYGHDIFAWKRWNGAQKTLAVTASVMGDIVLTTVLERVVVMPLPGTTKAENPRMREIEANDIAMQYLKQLRIPPSALFDAFLKSAGTYGDEESAASAGGQRDHGKAPAFPDDFPPDFSDPVCDLQSAADLGKLLDAGMVASAPPVPSPTPAKDVLPVAADSSIGSGESSARSEEPESPLDNNSAAQ